MGRIKQELIDRVEQLYLTTGHQRSLLSSCSSVRTAASCLLRAGSVAFVKHETLPSYGRVFNSSCVIRRRLFQRDGTPHRRIQDILQPDGPCSIQMFAFLWYSKFHPLFKQLLFENIVLEMHIADVKQQSISETFLRYQPSWSFNEH